MDWRGVVPAATEQRGEGDGDLRPDCRVCVFSHRQSRPVPAFLSSEVPERALGDRGWPGLAGWMKAQIQGKTRNQGRDWAVFRCPDEKKGVGGLTGTMAGDALRAQPREVLEQALDYGVFGSPGQSRIAICTLPSSP
jgi:hypothetical protein